MLLTVPERLTLLEILPKEGSVLTLRVLRELQTNLSFTEKELKQYKMKIEAHGGRLRVNWDTKIPDDGKKIQIGEAATAIIVRQLKELDRMKKLTMNMLTIYDKFVEKAEKPN